MCHIANGECVVDFTDTNHKLAVARNANSQSLQRVAIVPGHQDLSPDRPKPFAIRRKQLSIRGIQPSRQRIKNGSGKFHPSIRTCRNVFAETGRPRSNIIGQRGNGIGGHIQTDPNHRDGRNPQRGLGQNAGELSFADQNVIGPFEGDRINTNAFHRVNRSQAHRHRHSKQPVGAHPTPDEDRHHQRRVRRGQPLAVASASPGRLVIGDASLFDGTTTPNAEQISVRRARFIHPFELAKPAIA